MVRKGTDEAGAMSWPENLRLLNGLWPEASWTPEESALYREMLEPLDQQDLAKSIKRSSP